MTSLTHWRVEDIHWYSEPDDLEHGCDPDKAVHSAGVVDIQADDLYDLITSLFDWINCPVDWRAVELDSCDEPGRIDIQVCEDSPCGTVYDPGQVIPALQEQAAARVAARLTSDPEPSPSVWLTTYTVYVQRVTVEDRIALTPLAGWLAESLKPVSVAA